MLGIALLDGRPYRFLFVCQGRLYIICVLDTMLAVSTIPLPLGPLGRPPCIAMSTVSGDEAHAVSVLGSIKRLSERAVGSSVVGAMSSTHCFGVALVALSELACASTFVAASLQSASRDLQGRKKLGGIARSMRTLNVVHCIRSVCSVCSGDGVTLNVHLWL